MIKKVPVDLHAFALDLHYTNAARAGWEYLLNNLQIKAPFKILVPSYIGYTDREGSGVFDPITNSGTPYTFYRLNRKLEPDVEHIKEIIQKGKIKLLLWIHYFGICQGSLEQIREICTANGVYLLEDCAHAYNLFNDNSKLGSVGDFSFYSLHKYFAVQNGGILRVNNGMKLHEMPSEIACERKTLEQIFSTDTKTIAKKRHDNYQFLYNKLKNVPHLEVMYAPQKENIPHDFPVIIKNGLREKTYFALMDKGLPTVALYYRMVDTIPIEAFPDSSFVSQNILNLPVHQDTSLEDLELLTKELIEVLNILNQ